MERLALENLKKWRNDAKRKPLLVWGARQVGKTYLIKDIFAERFYKNKYIYIDFSKNLEIKEKLKNVADPKVIIERLQLTYEREINKDILLIFDEIQNCPSIITSLKYFCQDYREIPVIATGSMVRIKLREKPEKDEEEILFPVGKINTLNIYPLTFIEYIFNKNKILYERLKENYEKGESVDEYVHQIALEYLYRFLLVGGMPEALNTYIENDDSLKAIKKIKELYETYLEDMSSYQKSQDSILKTRELYRHIYMELNKESKNFSPGLIKEGSKTRDYSSPITWLELANVVNKSYQLKEHVTIPLIEEDINHFRLYLGDVGIFTYQSGIDAAAFVSKEVENTLSGIFYENFVANELVAKDIPLFYWKGKKSNEIEFVVQSNGRLIPIDVKKGRAGLNSLQHFSNHNKYDFAIKISNNNTGYNKEKKLLTIPFYFTSFLAEDLANGNDIPFIKD